MKKLLSLALVLATVINMSVTAFAADNILDNENKTGSTDITYDVSESYVVTIPDSMTVGTDATISVSDVILAEDYRITVSVSSTQYNNGWKLKNNSDTIGYTLKINDEDVINYDIILNVNAGEEVSKNLVTAIAEGQKPKYSGSYTDTLTFTVAPKGPYSFDATTADADTLKRSLLNELKAGGTNLTITLAPDADETMFTTIAEALSEEAADGTVCLTIDGATTIPERFLCDIYGFDSSAEIDFAIRTPSAKIKKIVLTDATSIGNEAFINCTNLISVDAPKATTIGDLAFKYCTSLTSVNLPKATTISISVFADCTTLTTLNLPLANSLGGGFIGSSSSLTELRLTATGTISVTTDALYDFNNTFDDASTTKIDLYLNIDKQSEVTNGNTWQGYTFKSITFVDTTN